MLYFRNERRHGTGNLKKDLFLGHLQFLLDQNSEDLEIFILEFDDDIAKTIYCFLSSLEWGGGGGSRRSTGGGPGFVLLKTC